MLGNGAGRPGLGQTGLVRHLTTVTPAAPQKTKGKQSPKKAGSTKLDEVVRDELGDLAIAKLTRDDESQGGEYQGEECEQPPSHQKGKARFTGKAFREAKGRQLPPAFSDVDQGNLGDAWLLACFAAVAHAQPAQIMKRITRAQDGTFTVLVQNDLLCITPEFAAEGYADPMPNNQEDTLWVAILEKAFATVEAGSYALLECGNPSRALEALTGQRSRRVAVTPFIDRGRFWKTLRDARRAEHPMVVRTRDGTVEDPLVGDHVYAVLDAYERDKVRYVKLYNPWGTKRGSRPMDAMVHEVELDRVIDSGISLHVGGR